MPGVPRPRKCWGPAPQIPTWLRAPMKDHPAPHCHVREVQVLSHTLPRVRSAHLTGRPKTDRVDRVFPHRPAPTASRVHAVGPPARELDVLAPLEGLDRHLLHLAVLVNVDHRGRVQV